MVYGKKVKGFQGIGGDSASQLLSGKKFACNAGGASLIPGSGTSPGGGNGNPLQYLCLENLLDRGAWWVTVRGIAKSQT